VVLLRVIAVDLRSCLADLLRDDEFRVAFDDAFYCWVIVARDQQEVVALAHDPFIHRWRNLDRGKTRDPSAFAVKRQRCLDSVLPGALFDLVVDLPKDLLVARCSLREIHFRIFADRREAVLLTSLALRSFAGRFAGWGAVLPVARLRHRGRRVPTVAACVDPRECFLDLAARILVSC